MGIAAAIVYVTIGRSRVDYRFILAGAVAPDLIDGITCAFYECGGGRGVAHSLLSNVAVTILIILLLRGETRLAVFGILMVLILPLPPVLLDLALALSITLSVLILLGGAISLGLLPISEYPEVAPPSVVVRASYPGASPKVVADWLVLQL